MTKLRYLRKKRAKGRDYYYLDLGKCADGSRELKPLPNIRDPRFGDCYARALATRTSRERLKGILTLDGLIRQYERSPEFKALSANSQVSYTRYLTRASSLMRTPRGDSVPVKKIERRDVLALREELSDTPGAANQAVRALSALFSWAMDNEKAKANPAERIKKFKGAPHKEWPETLLEEALADPQVGMPVALLYFTGQRIDDVVAMTWNAIRGDHMLVHVKKKDKDIRVAILPELAERLDKLERPTLTILSNANGQPWSQSGLRQKLQDWAKGRGHKVVPHGLRKNAVNALFEAGCTAAQVSGITDQSIGMLEHYALGVNKLTLGRAAVVKLDAARKARNKAGK
jgi:integrase